MLRRWRPSRSVGRSVWVVPVSVSVCACLCAHVHCVCPTIPPPPCTHPYTHNYRHHPRTHHAHTRHAPCFPPLPLQAERSEAASLLERRLAAIEALLTARRQVAAAAVETVEPSLPDFMQPPPTVGWVPGLGGSCRQSRGREGWAVQW